MQELALTISLLVVAIIMAVFLTVIVRSGTRVDFDGVQTISGRIRKTLLWTLIIVGIGVAAVSLRHLPYVSQAAAADGPLKVINATGYQWYWELDEESVPVGTTVEFHVTSGDVNHGFGIYDARTRLLAQVQAMPGYVNRLRYTFRQPGTYRIMCLEYCGLVHHAMIAEFEVLPEGTTTTADSIETADTADTAETTDTVDAAPAEAQEA